MSHRRKSEANPNSQPPSAEEIASALQLFQSLVNLPVMQTLFDDDVRTDTRMVYTKGVTLWMLISQRINGGSTLEEAVSFLQSHGRDLLPNNKRVRENTLSRKSGTYSQARKRLPLEFILDFSERLCNYLGEISEPIIDERRVFIIDGTTITLAPTKALQKAFPPATNQHGQSVWPVAQLMVAHELQSGCALLPQIDPMYGENNASEAVQAHRIVAGLPAKSVVMADANFGIFSVAHHSAKAGHALLFRLSHSRFKSLRREAELIEEDLTHKTYHLHWTPSLKDRQSNPDLPSAASIEVWLHEVVIGPDKKLYMVTNLEVDGITASQLYQRRYDVEFDIRDVKVTLDAENIRAKDVETVKKELFTSIVAFNLVAQFRRQAAQVARLKPRRLSFKSVWTIFKDMLLRQPPCSYEEWLKRYEDALNQASKMKLPNRKKPRSYARKAHPRRAKSTKFEKAERRKNRQPKEEAPVLMEAK